MATRYLIALLCLLALATSASAECAWVLWSTVEMAALTYREGVQILEAFKSESECRVLATRMREKKKGDALGWTRETIPGTGQVTARYTYLCLPDTVDPRGPKGK